MSREGTNPEGKLSGIGNLFKKSWEIYKRRSGTLIFPVKTFFWHLTPGRVKTGLRKI